MMDAVRFLPFLGLALWMVPLLWPVADAAMPETQTPMPLSAALKYIFGIWALLTLGAWGLWRRTRTQADKDSVRNAGTE